MQTVDVDVVIIGGGIAGLWTLASLRKAGYQAVLLEADRLGGGQTRFAQGIIHGGTKYALTGKLTASSEAVADMPALWQKCFEGQGELDLSSARRLSESHYLWSTASIASRMTGFFASKVMRSRTDELKKSERPNIFQSSSFRGSVYRLGESVFDTMSVIKAIATPLMDVIVSVKRESLKLQGSTLTLEDNNGEPFAFKFKKIMLMAGQGNGLLLKTCQQNKPEMQLRPLKMVMVRGGLPDKIYAHCMGASVNPRITVTSHEDKQGEIVWYLGGQLAEDGVNRSDEEQIKSAQSELTSLFPWVDLSKSQWAVVSIDRAEIKQAGKSRPNSFSIEDHNNVITAWPTKMALSPALAKTLIEKIKKEGIECSQVTSYPEWSKPAFADLPWCEESRWK